MYGLSSTHVHRSRPKPRLTARHPPARELPRGRQGPAPAQAGVKKRTLLNLSDWPREHIAGFKALLKGGTVIPRDQAAISIVRSLPHGAVAAALATARKIGLDRLIGPAGNRCRDLILALAVSRILDPGSKLAASRARSPETATSSLGAELGLGPVDEEELYGALDWLAVRQTAIETALARRHLTGGTLVLYDVTSS